MHNRINKRPFPSKGTTYEFVELHFNLEFPFLSTSSFKLKLMFTRELRFSQKIDACCRYGEQGDSVVFYVFGNLYGYHNIILLTYVYAWNALMYEHINYVIVSSA